MANNAPVAVESDDRADIRLIDVSDENNPSSLVFLVPDSISDLVKNLPEDLQRMSEEQLHELAQPEFVDLQLKNSFWAALDKCYLARDYAQKDYYKKGISQFHWKSIRVTLAEVVNGICTPGYFKKFCAAPENLAWLCAPPSSFRNRVEALLHIGYMRMYEIVTKTRLFEANGQLNTRAAELIVKAVHDLENRYFGAAVQRKIVKANIAAETASSVVDEKIEFTNYETLDATIENLQKRLGEIREKNNTAVTEAVVAEIVDEVTVAAE